MQHREFTLAGQGDVALAAQAWLPDAPAIGVLVIAHGLGEHSGRYGELVARCVARGLAVYALDHRGHGRSGGRRAQVGRFAWLVHDLDALIAHAWREHPGVKRLLFGHSMGGAIALTWALDHPDGLDGLILSGPAVAPTSSVSAARIGLIRLLSRLLPNLGAMRLPAESVSRDPAVVRAYADDPLVFHGAVPARTLAELLGAMLALPGRAPALRVPVLVLQGTGDLLVPYPDVRPVFEQLGSPDKTVHIYEGLFHEVLNEPERAQVLADIERWLDTQR